MPSVAELTADPGYERIAFAAGDGLALTLQHLRRSPPGGQPVLLVHGAGVRSNIFRPPVAKALPDMLADAGFDVWLLDWRASIDIPPNEWTLDDAAVHDYPAAIAEIRMRTGASTVKAVIHCQGSTSFMMSAVAGLLPDVDTVIANAVALHTVVPRLASMKSRLVTGIVSRLLAYTNPQWGLSAPGVLPKMIDFYVRATHHECNNIVCKHASFTYGSGFPTLWRHENLNDEIHEWLKGEFAHVPMSFFRQMARCLKAGHLVSTGIYDGILPGSFVASAPRTDARFVFLGGEHNVCFLPESMMRTYDFFDRYAPGKHSFQELAGYGHLDVFMGKDAARDTLPLIVDELKRG